MASKPNASTKPRTPLSRERVLEAAIRLADEGGIESLSMRKLARELGVEAMSLYNHVANKDDLLDAITDLVVSEIELPQVSEEWDVAVRACAISAYEAFMRHPWACSLVMSPTRTRTVPAARVRYIEWLLRCLREAGFSPGLAYHGYHALDSHILGFTLWHLGHTAGAKDLAGEQDFAEFATGLVEELRAEGYPYLAEHAEQHIAGVEGEGEFEFGLDLILDGLKRARAAAAGAA
jgi:AcrR family transcriptional regulator